jgi:hypothetical protein
MALYDLYADDELLVRCLYIEEIEATIKQYRKYYAEIGRYPKFKWVRVA